MSDNSTGKPTPVQLLLWMRLARRSCMPELPEVETVVRTLRRRLAGRIIESVRLVRPDIVRPAVDDLPRRLCQRTIRAITRRGKRILIGLDDASHLCIHLGMTGRLTIERADAPLLPHTHLVVRILADACRSHGLTEYRDTQGQDPGAPLPRHPVASCTLQLRFRDPRRFGRVGWISPGQATDDGLGPEPIEMTAGELRGRLSRTRRAIKTALLDQKLIAGIGNIYADEALFEARIDPRRCARRLSVEQVGRLHRAIRKVLLKAIRHRGSTLRDYVDANGGAGAFQRLHRVYGRAGLPCRVCLTPIRRIILGGRSTHFCGKCQTG